MIMCFKFHLDPANNEVERTAFLVKKTEKVMFLQLFPFLTHTHIYTLGNLKFLTNQTIFCSDNVFQISS